MAPVILPRLARPEDDETAEREIGEPPVIAVDGLGIALWDEESMLSEANVEKRRFDGDGVGGGRVGGAMLSSAFSHPCAGGSSLVIGSPIICDVLFATSIAAATIDMVITATRRRRRDLEMISSNSAEESEEMEDESSPVVYWDLGHRGHWNGRCPWWLSERRCLHGLSYVRDH